MTRKVVLLLISLILILSVSACQLGAADEYETGDPIKQPINPEKQATPTPEPSQAIMANTGVHAYSITATENTCALTLKEGPS